MKYRIAYIDDSKCNLEAIGTLLSNVFDIDCYLRSNSFLKSYAEKQYDAILVDLHMPQMNGFETYEAIIGHVNYNGCPILIISSDNSIESRVRAFELGAVDFINRNSTIEELTTLIHAKIQYYQKNRSILGLDNIKVNQTLLKVFVNHLEVLTTLTEIKLISFLLRNYPHSPCKNMVKKHIWNDCIVVDNTLHTHIFNLNNKLVDWSHEVKISKSDSLVEVVKKS